MFLSQEKKLVTTLQKDAYIIAVNGPDIKAAPQGFSLKRYNSDHRIKNVKCDTNSCVIIRTWPSSHPW